MMMPLSYAVRARPDFDAQTADTPEVSLYPSDLLSAMQGVLAALADLETYHEVERARLEQEVGSADEKQRLLAGLDANVHAWRERLGLRLAQLRMR
jgi:hypothetical protein